MGRNNRARRQQKQRGKQKKTRQSKTQGLRIDPSEVMALTQPVVTSVTYANPPPPSIMKHWATTHTSPEGALLRTQLLSFVDFVFHQQAANGDAAQLRPFKQVFKQLELEWLYTLLYGYCLISDKSLSDSNHDTLLNALNSDTLARDSGVDSLYELEEPWAPLYAWLSILNETPQSGAQRTQKYWLDQWLKHSPLHALVPSLGKFLKLKKPKATLKSVMALEKTLSYTGATRDGVWQQAMSQLVGGFLRHRLDEKQLNANAWQSTPQLASLAGLTTEAPTTEHWTDCRIAETNNATLNQLERQIDTRTMTYEQRLQLEALKCRLLSEFTHQNDIDNDEFEHQLEQLLNMLCTGVPPEHTQIANACLDSTCDWLAEKVSSAYIQVPNTATLRRLNRKRPNDFRVAVLVYLANEQHPPKVLNTDFQHKHFELFFFALKHLGDPAQFIQYFYSPLSSETKKDWYLQCSQKLFWTLDELEQKDSWQEWSGLLIDINQQPFLSIVKGQACETRVLFYIVLALLNSKTKLSWLQAHPLAGLLREANHLLTKRSTPLAQELIIKMLNALISTVRPSFPIEEWDLTINLINRLDSSPKLEPFLRQVLNTIIQQEDVQNNRYDVFYSLCRRYPSLRKTIPKQKKSPNKKRKNHSKIPATLDLFGDLT
ncbi:hypothetical protein JYU12_00770 [bacterium AH-315-K03]|nr:hypothetical protein [bacterium AH-315-K03]